MAAPVGDIMSTRMGQQYAINANLWYQMGFAGPRAGNANYVALHRRYVRSYLASATMQVPQNLNYQIVHDLDPAFMIQDEQPFYTYTHDGRLVSDLLFFLKSDSLGVLLDGEHDRAQPDDVLLLRKRLPSLHHELPILSRDMVDASLVLWNGHIHEQMLSRVRRRANKSRIIGVEEARSLTGCVQLHLSKTALFFAQHNEEGEKKKNTCESKKKIKTEYC